MPSYKLTYFNVRVRAEVPRLLFAKAGVEYEDVRVNDEQFKDMKDKTPFGQLPTLEVDGHVICQSIGITRFLGKRFGLYGKGEYEEARVDEVVLGVEDVIQQLFKGHTESDEKKKEEVKKKFQDEQLPAFLKFFERMLVQNNGGDGFFVGNSITAADLSFMNYMELPEIGGIQVDWSKYPKLSALRSRVTADERIATWIKNRPQTPY